MTWFLRLKHQGRSVFWGTKGFCDILDLALFWRWWVLWSTRQEQELCSLLNLLEQGFSILQQHFLCPEYSGASICLELSTAWQYWGRGIGQEPKSMRKKKVASTRSFFPSGYSGSNLPQIQFPNLLQFLPFITDHFNICWITRTECQTTPNQHSKLHCTSLQMSISICCLPIYCPIQILLHILCNRTRVWPLSAGNWHSDCPFILTCLQFTSASDPGCHVESHMLS